MKFQSFLTIAFISLLSVPTMTYGNNDDVAKKKICSDIIGLVAYAQKNKYIHNIDIHSEESLCDRISTSINASPSFETYKKLSNKKQPELLYAEHLAYRDAQNTLIDLLIKVIQRYSIDSIEKMANSLYTTDCGFLELAFDY